MSKDRRRPMGVTTAFSYHTHGRPSHGRPLIRRSPPHPPPLPGPPPPLLPPRHPLGRRTRMGCCPIGHRRKFCNVRTSELPSKRPSEYLSVPSPLRSPAPQDLSPPRAAVTASRPPPKAPDPRTDENSPPCSRGHRTLRVHCPASIYRKTPSITKQGEDIADLYCPRTDIFSPNRIWSPPPPPPRLPTCYSFASV